ncbi:hypothetical protein [Intrasporangium sp. YIM S08009]|uniref:hypothetical protein n=1 Tax=Intrasporangium zincisolvens TaxID=3080018 RepID=UPI002B054DA5|nr:hypothetical protein [Intrasporangium sp. YIM S08009]
MARFHFTAHRLATAAQLLTFLAAFLGIFGQVWYLTATAGGLALVLYIASLVIAGRERRKVRREVDRVVDAIDIDHVLREAALSLGLQTADQGWRLTLYRLDFADGSPAAARWTLEARAANQKVYELSDDLEVMTLGQGVLRTAVASADRPVGGIDEMPPVPNRTEDPAGWKSIMDAWGLAESDLGEGMQSRAYCGRVFRVGLNRGKGQDMTLGLVAESLSPSGVRRQAVEEILTRPVFELLYELIRLREEVRTTLAHLDMPPR